MLAWCDLSVALSLKTCSLHAWLLHLAIDICLYPLTQFIKRISSWIFLFLLSLDLLFCFVFFNETPRAEGFVMFSSLKAMHPPVSVVLASSCNVDRPVCFCVSYLSL